MNLFKRIKEFISKRQRRREHLDKVVEEWTKALESVDSFK